MELANVNQQRNRMVAAAGIGALADTLAANRQLIGAIVRRLGPGGGAGAGPSAGAKGKRKAGKRTAKKQQQQQSPGAAFGPMNMVSTSSSGRNVMRVKDCYMQEMFNTGASTFQSYYNLGFNNKDGWTNGTPIFSSFARLGAIKALYRHFRILRMRFTFVPNQADTTSGNFMLRIEADPTVTVNASNADRYINAETHIFTHIQKGASATWLPKEQKEKAERYITDTGNALSRPMEDMSFGVVQVYAPNSQGSGVSIGFLKFDVEVEFSNAYV